MAELEVAFRLPLPGWPRALFESDYAYDGGRVLIDGAVAVEAGSRAALACGVERPLPGSATRVRVQLVTHARGTDVALWADGQPALREDKLRAPPSRSAWTHACLALAGSAAGFVASYLYLVKAAALQSEWALKMGNHTAGWHLLLTFTLFPASVWGQRTGIRMVQLVGLLFFFIHAGIALANLGPSDSTNPDDAWIAFFNAASGVLFLITAIYGNRAHRDMDPVEALRHGRLRPGSNVGPALPAAH